MNRERYIPIIIISNVLPKYCFVWTSCVRVVLISPRASIRAVFLWSSMWPSPSNFTPQGFRLCGSRQPDAGSEVSCFPLWLPCQEHRHQFTRNVFKGRPLSHFCVTVVPRHFEDIWFVVSCRFLAWNFNVFLFWLQIMMERKATKRGVSRLNPDPSNPLVPVEGDAKHF